MLFWLGTIIFVTTYILIATEKLNKTAVAVGGAMLMMLVIIPHDANSYSPQFTKAGELIKASSETDFAGLNSFSKFVDFDVIFTLAGMMILVNILSGTGLFQYVAIKAAKIAKGSPVNTMILLVFSTAILSAFLDNVTTVLLIAPITLVVASELKVPPIPFLMAETIASNIGGSATLIGDPPNLIIGSKAGLSFGAFMVNLSPFILVILVLYCFILFRFYREKMTVTIEQRARIMGFNDKNAITDMKTLKKAGFITILTLVGFLLHGAFHIEPSVIAMSGAAAALLFCCSDIEHALAKIEWETIFFFLGLFIVVKGAEYAGLMHKIASVMSLMDSWHPLLIITAMIWICGIGAAITNNVSFTAAIVVIIGTFINTNPQFAGEANIALAETFWWAVALAVCLGGNGTIVGAAANLVTVNIAKKGGCNISFQEFFKFGFPVTIATLIFTNIYIVIRYYAICQ